MQPWTIIDLATTDAEFNLAAEQYVFDELPRDRSYLMLWQNRRAVIVGKYQNTLAEINAGYVSSHEVQVVRRLSGGGAVYHDLGNLNFTLITDAGKLGSLDLRQFCLPVVRTLRALGVPAELNGRNDITIEGLKCSGNSQYMKQGRVMHHGTMLFDSDLEAVAQALRVDRDKIEAKGIRSVRSRVTNIRPFLRESCSLTEFRSRFIREFMEENDGCLYCFDEHAISRIEAIRAARYARWDWNYGSSPAFHTEKKRRLEGCGTICVHLSTDRGLITQLAYTGDFFSTRDPAELAGRLIGQPLREEALERVLCGEDPALYFTGLTKEQFYELMLY